MTRPYFRQVPDFEYVSRNKGDNYISNYVPVKNFFKRGKLREDIFSDLSLFERYSIIGDERPDNVAFKFYNDSTLDWVVLLSNNILNIQSEWPMVQKTFDKVMLEKYGSYDNLFNGVHHYETIGIKNSLGITVVKPGIRIAPKWKTNGNFLEIVNSQIATISSGDSVEPSNVVTVYMVFGIPGLEIGKQVTINNVSEPQYNGQHVITEILATDENSVTGFRYELPFVPNIASPRLANPRKEEVLFTISDTSTIIANSYYYEYWDQGLGYSVLVPSYNFITAVTNYEYEKTVEEAKRNIYILKSDYLNIIFNDMDDIMRYKKGSQQYVSENLKRGDNIRLYE